MRAAAFLLLLALAACDKGGSDGGDQPVTRSMGKFKTATLNYPGRWAATAMACSTKWWDFGADQVKMQDGSSCIFQRETPTAVGVDLEVACIGGSMSTVEQWRLTSLPDERISLVRGTEPPVMLARCPEI